MITLDFRKVYKDQSKEVKNTISKHDFYEVANLIRFKKVLKKIKKVLTNNK